MPARQWQRPLQLSVVRFERHTLVRDPSIAQISPNRRGLLCPSPTAPSGFAAENTYRLAIGLRSEPTIGAHRPSPNKKTFLEISDGSLNGYTISRFGITLGTDQKQGQP